MAKARVLVIDDEEDILELVRYNLSREGYTVDAVTSGEEGLDRIAAQRPDVVLLDLMLPGIDGLEVCRRIKSNTETSQLPVIILSAKGDEADVVAGLELGADDYVTKPFSPRILLARVRAAGRRNVRRTPSDRDILRYEGLEIHPGRHEVWVDGKRVEFTRSEFKILHFLARQVGWVFTRAQIVDAVKGEDYAVTERSVDVQIVGIRKKLGSAGTMVETVRGVGYRFREPE